MLSNKQVMPESTLNEKLMTLLSDASAQAKCAEGSGGITIDVGMHDQKPEAVLEALEEIKRTAKVNFRAVHNVSGVSVYVQQKNLAEFKANLNDNVSTR